MTIQRVYTNPLNSAGLDAQQIASATKTIDFAAYSLTEPLVCNALLQRATAGVRIRLYLDRSEIEAEARGNPGVPLSPLHLLIGQPNIEILVKHSMVLMHLKSYCIDSKLLRDGSANFSPQGEFQEDNSVEWTDDPASIAAFQTKFEAMWARADNQSISAAVQGSPSYAAARAHQH